MSNEKMNNNPDIIIFKNQLISNFGNQNYTQAELVFEQAVLLAEQGDKQDAITHAEFALALTQHSSNDSGAHCITGFIAQLYCELKKFEKAKEYYKLGLSQLNPESALYEKDMELYNSIKELIDEEYSPPDNTVKIERTIPRPSLGILRPLLEGEKPSEENYLKKIYKFERESEKFLKELLWKINIDALVKTNPYSLPYQKELVYKLGYESWLNEPYRLSRITRNIANELLAENIYSIRFYMFINVVEFNPDESDFLLQKPKIVMLNINLGIS